MSSHLSLDSVPLLAAGVGVHLAFKRDEDPQFSRIFRLLLGVPTFVYILFGDESKGVVTGFFRDLVSFYATIALSIMLYRLSPWHPIAAYPGPLLCKVSKIYWAVLARNGDQNRLLTALHEKYGQIVRIGPNEVSIADASAIDPLMGISGQPKGQFWEGRLPLNAPSPNLVGVRIKKDHARRRKTWQRALIASSIKYYEGFVLSRTQQMVDLLGEKLSAPVEMSEWLGYYTFDLMGDLVFGEGPEMMKNGDLGNLWHLLEESQKTLFLFGLVPWFGRLMLRLGQLVPMVPLVPGVKQYRQYTVNRVFERRNRGSPNKDLFHYLIDEDGVLPERPSNVEIASDSALAIVAGADTTATGLANVFYFIMQNHRCYKRLQEEIDSLGGDLMNTEKQAKLMYLNATINEALRLLPPVQSGSQREVQCGTGVAMIGPYPLPEGTAASIAFRIVHKDHRNFSPYPELFLPERWLPKAMRETLEPDLFNCRTPYALNHNAFLAFSYGPANCIGKQLAYVEMRLAICMLLHRYSLAFAPGYDPLEYEHNFGDYYIVVKGRLPVILTPRCQPSSCT